MYYIRLLLAFSLATLTTLTWCRAGYLLWQLPFNSSCLLQVTTYTLASAMVAFSFCYALTKFETIHFPEIGTWFPEKNRPERPEGALEVLCTFVVLMLAITVLTGWQWQTDSLRWALYPLHHWSQYFVWAWYLYCGLIVITAIQAQQQKRLYESWAEQDQSAHNRSNPPVFSGHPSPFLRGPGAVPFYVPPPYVDDRGPDGKPVSPSAQ